MAKVNDMQSEIISVSISDDALEAYITLNFLPDELKDDHTALIQAIQSALKNADVNYGIIQEALFNDIPLNTPVLIAKGKPPVHGKDFEIKMYSISDPKPRIIDNGKVNYYDLDLIHHVKAGDWLGERTDPVPGSPGIDVHGNEIKPNEGILYPLVYDQNSVIQVRQQNKDVLYSLKDGAVHYVDNCIAVYDVLEIKGDVDFNVGNIDFDGYVNIKGTVEDNFSVKATKDIEISGEYGIGGVKLIESTEGSIYVRGGIAGKNRAKIKCRENLYAKFLSDTEVECEGIVYIGFYVRNCNIRAKQVIVESGKGQIVGGNIDADVSVESADVGNRMETRTIINIRGFNRELMKMELDETVSAIQSRKKRMNELISNISSGINTQNDKSEAKKMQREIFLLQEEIKKLESKCSSINNYLKVPGEGALIVKNYIYPKVKITIKNEVLDVIKQEFGPTYVFTDGKVQTV